MKHGEIYNSYSIAVDEIDFEEGTLKKISNIRPNKIFTADRGIVLYKAGHLNAKKINEVIDIVIRIFKED